MLWPTPADYAQAVGGFPDVSLLDSKLKGGKPKRDHTNLLLVYSGGFSTVFPIETITNIYALRCWTRDIGDSKSRYEKITAYLKHVHLPYFVDFEYVPEGILINGKRYPITRMEWANGELLRDFIKRNLQNAAIFKTAANEFQKMVAALHTHQISHGDLQNGNILIKRNGTDVEIKLIDYDSLFVPALRGQPSPTPGLPEYQHPARGALSNEKVDYFSELVIYLSFLSLAEKPGIWGHFDLENRTGDGLLFSKKDFENPEKSDIFQELEKLSPDVQQLAATLKDFCAKTSIDQLKPLETILPKQDANGYSNRGNSFLNDGRYNEALTEFHKAIALDPNYKKARYGIGRVYLHSKRYNDAINAFEQLIKDEPNYKEVHHGLGLAYFKSGDNSKAEASAYVALKIDPYYQPARDLLDVIKTSSTSSVTPPPTTKSTPTSTNPTSSSTSSQATRSNPLPNIMKDITERSRNHWQSVAMATLGVALIICLIALLIQMDTGNDMVNQLQQLSNQNQLLQEQLVTKDDKIRQLRNDKATAINENQRLKNQIDASNQGTTDQNAVIQQLQREKAKALTENQRLQGQLAAKTSEAKNLTARTRQLQNEKIGVQRQNQKLENENEVLIRQNRNLRNESVVLPNRPNKTNPKETNKIVGPEPPKKIQDYRNVGSGAGSHNTQGIIAFNRKNYDKAIGHFRTAIETNSKFEAAYYNLGCAYFVRKRYYEALAAFNEAVRLNSGFKEAHYNLGLTYFRIKAFAAAKKAVNHALSTDRNYQLAQRLLNAIEGTRR